MFSYCAVGLKAGWPGKVTLEWNFSMQAQKFFSYFTLKFKKSVSQKRDTLPGQQQFGWQGTKYRRSFHSRGKVCSMDIPGSQIVISLGACWFPLFRRPWDRQLYPKKCTILRVPSSNTMDSKFVFSFDFMKHFQFLFGWKNRKLSLNCIEWVL